MQRAPWRHHPYSPAVAPEVDDAAVETETRNSAPAHWGSISDSNPLSIIESAAKPVADTPGLRSEDSRPELLFASRSDHEIPTFDSLCFKFFGTPSMASIGTPSLRDQDSQAPRGAGQESANTPLLVPAAVPASQLKKEGKVWDSFQDLARCPRKDRFVQSPA
jgi:hypothetical protein